MNKREEIIENYPNEEIWFADGFDNAILGIESDSMRVVYSVDKTLKIWNVKDGKRLNTLIGHNHCVNSGVYSPCGKYILSASYDNTLKLWTIIPPMLEKK